jgi:hypothetical protein
MERAGFTLPASGRCECDRGKLETGTWRNRVLLPSARALGSFHFAEGLGFDGPAQLKDSSAGFSGFVGPSTPGADTTDRTSTSGQSWYINRSISS